MVAILAVNGTSFPAPTEDVVTDLMLPDIEPVPAPVALTVSGEEMEEITTSLGDVSETLLVFWDGYCIMWVPP